MRWEISQACQKWGQRGAENRVARITSAIEVKIGQKGESTERLLMASPSRRKVLLEASYPLIPENPQIYRIRHKGEWGKSCPNWDNFRGKVSRPPWVKNSPYELGKRAESDVRYFCGPLKAKHSSSRLIIRRENGLKSIRWIAHRWFINLDFPSSFSHETLDPEISLEKKCLGKPGKWARPPFWDLEALTRKSLSPVIKNGMMMEG